MKLGIFTDAHYSSHVITCGKRYNSKSLEKIKKAYVLFEREKCDLAVCLGDITDKENTLEKEIENLEKIARVISASSVRTVCLMGNHDAFTFTKEQFYSILGTDIPSAESVKDRTLIFLDTCYFSTGTHYSPGDTNWRDTYLPDVTALKKQLSDAQGNVYVFMHHNIDPNVPKDHRLSNDVEIRKTIEESRKVKTVFQGHYHPGKESICDGIEYTTFPAMCENDNAFFIINI